MLTVFFNGAANWLQLLSVYDSETEPVFGHSTYHVWSCRSKCWRRR